MWTLGVEIELIAPRGLTRRDLATAIAAREGGEVEPCFHLDSEPSKVPGKPIFHNLGPAFRVTGPRGWLARVTDDLTLQDDLDRQARPPPGWYRIVSDDARLLRLVDHNVDPRAPLEQVLDPIAALFGTEVEAAPGGLRRVADATGLAVALAAPLPGERERPAELVTSPMRSDRAARLDRMLSCARALGFTAPAEGATHLHLDARPLHDAAAVQRLVHLVSGMEPGLRRLLRTNPRCRRLGPWPDALRATVDGPGFAALPWEEARTRLASLGLSKYVDLNLKNLVHPLPDKHTIEWRILPVHLDPEPVLDAAALLTALVERALEPQTIPLNPGPHDLRRWLDRLPLAPAPRRRLLDGAAPA